MAQLELHLYDEMHDWFTPPLKLGTPKLFNLILDPKNNSRLRSKTLGRRAHDQDDRRSTEQRKNPLIAPGTPDPYAPPK